MGKSGPKLRPVSSLKSRSGRWYRTQASPAQRDNAIATATKYSSTPANTKKRSEDNKMRKKLKIKSSWMNASRKKGGGWTVQPDYINKAANGSGKRSRYSA